MFQKKRDLSGGTDKQTKSTNAFLSEGLKKSAETRSGNNALKYNSTGNSFLDDFGSLGNYLKPRSFAEVSTTMSTLWAISAILAIKMIGYVRTITRKVSNLDGEVTDTVQRGTGLKSEGIMRMIWLAVNYPDSFYKNLPVFISLGSWKDLFEMMRLDIQYHSWEDRVLKWDILADFVSAGLENPNTSGLVKKYLPKIRSRGILAKSGDTAKANTIIGKYLMSRWGIKDTPAGYKEYRLLKSSGTAHQWQQLISKGKFSEIDFNSIHGRALTRLVSSEFLKNNGLESSYLKWLESKPVAKFTGYVHELGNKIKNGMSLALKYTIDKQFEGLVQLGKTDTNVDSRMIVVRDTSGSMTSNIPGQDFSAFSVAKALGFYFSHMLEGYFRHHWIEFNRDAKLHQNKGLTFTDWWLNDTSSIVGSTRIISVAELFVQLKRRGVPEEEFPTGVLCISDMEFDRTGEVNNVDAFKSILRRAFSQEYVDNFKIVLWDIPNSFYERYRSTKFETYGSHNNVFYLSGYDGSILSFLLGGKDSTPETTPKTAEELFEVAMDQEMLNLLEL